MDHVGLERSYFSKIFHKFTGTTAQNYLLNVRIQRSKLLLERTDYTVREICSYVGMKDEYYFSRAFKRSVGLSPPNTARTSGRTLHLPPPHPLKIGMQRYCLLNFL
ncbi:MAG: helix-turn-helix transcriptional regulator [Blautia marasmi]